MGYGTEWLLFGYQNSSATLCNECRNRPLFSAHNAFMPDSNYGLTGQPTGNAVRTAEQLAERTDLLLAKAEILAHGIGEPLPTFPITDPIYRF
jgi:hypothetical protein